MEAQHWVSHERLADHVLLVRLNRPEKRNALSNSMVIAIADHLTRAAEDADIRAVVLTGGDAAFCAGADIAEVRATSGQAIRDPRRVRAWNTIQSFPKPVIAAVNGYAFGAGNELAMTCDFIICGENARFGQPEVNIGGIAGDGGTQRLPRLIGSGAASFMLMSGLPIDARTAFRLGLVWEVMPTDQTVPRAVEIANVIAGRAPLAVQATKACIRACSAATLENGLALERELLASIIQSPDSAEGGYAFLEKRPPRFTGRWE
ncbi:enoyl-CoA hydratase/isomerase family protein [Labrys wisconsinensis]|uniref:Enoyl-CoA hydratase/carnithine racemase n=1 Tax=Labrys wisconsinensis TaxID=425677 RepID=A0ABU0JIZ4_9HYPH|nr:enoyl-CoA hydratase-related protein [Labrys wisconsinensis]MDQ0474248.1 enoyl-CoA hydratase/carnithine racemase [Labrys wisconsinensis]